MGWTEYSPIPQPFRNRLTTAFPGWSFRAYLADEGLVFLHCTKPGEPFLSVVECDKDISGNVHSNSAWDYIQQEIALVVDGTARTLTDRLAVDPADR